MPPHLYWGLVQLAERQILTLEVKGSSPLPPAKSRSVLDGTKHKSLKTSKVGFESSHPIMSGAVRATDLWCHNT